MFIQLTSKAVEIKLNQQIKLILFGLICFSTRIKHFWKKMRMTFFQKIFQEKKSFFQRKNSVPETVSPDKISSKKFEGK